MEYCVALKKNEDKRLALISEIAHSLLWTENV